MKLVESIMDTLKTRSVIIASFFFVFLSFLYFITEITILAFLIYLIVGISFLFFDYKKSYIMLLFFLPNSMIFENGMLKYILEITIGFTFLKCFLLEKKIRYDLLFFVILFVIFTSIKSIIYGVFVSPLPILRLMMNVYIMQSIFGNEVDKGDFCIYSIQSFLLGLFTYVTLSFVYPLLNSGFNSGLIFRFTSINDDPNYFSVMIVGAIFLTLGLFHVYKRINYLLLIALFVFVYAGLITVSRGFLVSFMIGTLLFVIFGLPRFKPNKVQILSFVSIVLIFIVALNVPHVISNYIDRFNVSDISGGRLELWSTYLNLFVSHPLRFNFGLEPFDRDLYLVKYGVVNVPHNIFLGSILSFGVPCTLLLIKLLLSQFKTNSNNVFSYLVMIPILIGTFFLDYITSNILFYSFSLAVMLGSLTQKYNSAYVLREKNL